MKVGNCLIWALCQKIKYGGKLIFCKSKLTYFNVSFPIMYHVLWKSPSGKTWTYTPINRINRDGSGWDYVILYQGKAIRYIEKKGKDN